MGGAWIAGVDGNPLTAMVKDASIRTLATDWDSTGIPSRCMPNSGRSVSASARLRMDRRTVFGKPVWRLSSNFHKHTALMIKTIQNDGTRRPLSANRSTGIAMFEMSGNFKR
jgi:hypothetical protein